MEGKKPPPLSRRVNWKRALEERKQEEQENSVQGSTPVPGEFVSAEPDSYRNVAKARLARARERIKKEREEAMAQARAAAQPADSSDSDVKKKPPLPIDEVVEAEALELEVKTIAGQILPLIKMIMLQRFDRDKKKEIDAITRDREMSMETEDTRGYGVSRAKENRGTDRLNEDALMICENGMVVCDGVSGRLAKNTSTLMSETTAIAGKAVFERLNAMDPKPNGSMIKNAIKMIPEIATLAIKTAIATEKKVSGEMKTQHIVYSDFCTTAEMVYIAPWLGKVFVGHIGDSRTYLISPGQEVEKIVKEHKSPVKFLNFITSFISPDQKPAFFDIIKRDFPWGWTVMSMTDGEFDDYERMHSEDDFNAALRRNASESLRSQVKAVHETAGECQEKKKRFDDRTVGAIENIAISSVVVKDTEFDPEIIDSDNDLTSDDEIFGRR
ncbi:MAG: protein phosphatase 2C domain-containing protein [Candidatus Kerfeldbacteria bacterium]